MNCHLLETGTRIAPFADPVGETPVANRPLAEWQRAVLSACGLQLAPWEDEPSGPCLVMADNLFLTRALLRSFLDAAARLPEGAVGVLRVQDSCLVRDTAPLQGLQLEERTEERATARYPLWYLAPGSTWRGVDAACEPLNVRPDEKLLRLPVPEQYFGKPEIVVPITGRAALRMRHWAHILAVNRIAWALDLLDRPRWRNIAALAWACIRALIPTRSRVLRRLGRIGKGCTIHPTAVLEGVILEDGVNIGPFAVVRFSRIGAGSWIQGHAQVSMSVLGARTLVSAGSVVNFSVTYPDASASQILMQLSVLGRKAITTGGGFMMDMRFDGDVRVPLDGELQDAGTRFLGSAVGHGAILGTGFWLAPGRAIPNGAVVVRNPRQVVRSIPSAVEPGTVLVQEGGRLVPLD